MDYFTHQQLAPGLIRIIDFTGVCCYLVVGNEKAALLDTCNGIGNIKEYAEKLTDKPIFVILTHGHLDHMGGAGLFDEVYMNPADIPVLRKHGDMKFRVEDTIAHIANGVEVKASEFVPTMEKDPLPLCDGQQFLLGGKTIRMILVKGHTPGMMCPLITEDRTIIFGDACGEAVLLFDEFSSDISEYRDSLTNLKQYENEYDKVYRNHGTFWSNKVLLDNVIECCDLILSGKDDRFETCVHGYQLYAAKKMAEGKAKRADGKEGNLLYSLQKVK